jgi:tetratricopeptide (TPR) repeat protein
VRNLESVRAGAWARFAHNPHAPRVAETIVDCEQVAIQFLSDYRALDRLEVLAEEFSRTEESYRASLVRAQVAAVGHRFGEARECLVAATHLGAPAEEIARITLSIDQACGVGLEAALEARWLAAEGSLRLEDRIPLGALLVDLERFEEADVVYREAFSYCEGVSPFPIAWVCFQLGVLWGEAVPEPNPDRATLWYLLALEYLPAYIKARVHLAEIYIRRQESGEAERLLRPALASGDPEVPWRLAEALARQGRLGETRPQMEAARSGFEALIGKHPLAFADHAAEFYAASGADRTRAFELARMNCKNRATRQAHNLMRTLGVELRTELGQ